jgi:hypothetical protein
LGCGKLRAGREEKGGRGMGREKGYGRTQKGKGGVGE